MVEISSQEKYRLALIGSTGAIGKEIVDYIKQDTRFSEVILLCRKPLAEWNPEEFKPKLTII